MTALDTKTEFNMTSRDTFQCVSGGGTVDVVLSECQVETSAEITAFLPEPDYEVTLGTGDNTVTTMAFDSENCIGQIVETPDSVVFCLFEYEDSGVYADGQSVLTPER